MIIIGKNYKGKIISVLNAKSEELANAYWHGANIIPHSTQIVDLDAINDNGTGVIPKFLRQRRHLPIIHSLTMVLRKLW